MKINKNILFLIFFFLILFSFSINALNSFNTVSADISYSTKKISNPKDNTSNSENLIFEELEEDGEDVFVDAFFLVPFYNLSHNISKCNTFSQSTSKIQKALQPIFISIRVLRI